MVNGLLDDILLMKKFNVHDHSIEKKFGFIVSYFSVNPYAYSDKGFEIIAAHLINFPKLHCNSSSFPSHLNIFTLIS